MGPPTQLEALPQYIERAHKQLLRAGGPWSIMDRGVLHYLQDALSEVNPFEDLEVYDPSEVLDNVAIVLEHFKDIVYDLEPTGDWTSYFNTVQTRIGQALGVTSTEASVEAFAQKHKPTLARSLNATMGSLFAANAAESSALLGVTAVLRRGYDASIGEHRTSLEREHVQERVQFVTQSVQQILALQQMWLQANERLSVRTEESEVRKIDIHANWNDRIVDVATNRVRWPLELFDYGNATLAAGRGMPTLQKGPSKIAQYLSIGLNAASQMVPLFAQLM